MKLSHFVISFKFYTTVRNLNPKYLDVENPCRGAILNQAISIQQEIKNGIKHPFDNITELNIGNPQAFGQTPITFNRNVISSLLDSSILIHQSKDVQNRVNFYKKTIHYNIGAYSESLGYQSIREAITKFIQRRDQTDDKPQITDIILNDGASSGIALILNLLISNKNDGVFIPVPQYPLYTGLITLRGASQIPYYLDEDNNWSIQINELDEQYQKAKEEGINPKILVCINPGNPTGQVLDKETIQKIIKFASANKLTIIADEVYQDNIYDFSKQFISFRKVAKELNCDVEIYSFHSTSKGIKGECGLRGGYMEITTPINNEVRAEIYKAKSIQLCPNTIGQIMTGLMVTPPSYEEGCNKDTIENYQYECNKVYQSLQQRAQTVQQYLTSTKGISCTPIQGAMYAFPKLELPNKFIEYSNRQNQIPDVSYCLDLLKGTGLVVVPGSGFLQYPGTHHFRMTTLLMPEERLLQKMQIFKEWHENYIQQFY